MKKFLKFLLIVVVVIAVVCVFDMYFNGGKLRAALKLGDAVSDDPTNGGTLHFHDYGAWETIKQAACEQDGIEERYCGCGEKQSRTIAAVGHSYGEWRTLQESTCTETGIEERSCACGLKETQSKATLPHTFGEWREISKATCTEQGVQERECVCGEKETASTKGTNHTYGQWMTAKPATCTQNGEKVRSCACGAKETAVIEKTNHTEGYRSVIKEATCVENGQARIPCAKCGEVLRTEIIPAKGHDYRSSTVTATCSEPGGVKHTCSRCADTYYEETTAPTGAHDLAITGICRKCSGDFSVDMTTRVSAPIASSRYGFSYYTPNNSFFCFSWQAENISNKTIKYCTVELEFYNAVGDVIATFTCKITGPFNMNKEMSIVITTGDWAVFPGNGAAGDTAEIEISYMRIEYMDGTVECGTYGYGTTERNDDLDYIDFHF